MDAEKFQCLVEVAIPPLLQNYSYLISRKDLASIKIGYQVAVPLQNRQTIGYVIKIWEKPDEQQLNGKFKLKPLKIDQNAYACFLPEQIEFFEWIARYYGSTLSSTIETAIPKSFPDKSKKVVTLREGGTLQNTLKGKTQKLIFDTLLKYQNEMDLDLLKKVTKANSGSIKRLVDLNILEVTEIQTNEIALPEYITPEWAKTNVILSSEQEQITSIIIDKSNKQEFYPTLLHGVTGSGKTEVYIEVIKEVVSQNKNALVIVPEIALTPQLLDRFTARLGGNIALLHSGLSPRARWEAWKALLQGKTKVAIGARSAVFAPLSNLGVIIVDEEHDSSFKQAEGLRYNGRDSAVMLAKLNNCPLILGSATPSLETFNSSKNSKYHYFRLPKKHSHSTPVELKLIDCSTKKPWDMSSPHISKELEQAIKEALAEGGQVFILYNKRGFASFIQCTSCEEVVSCPNCKVTLTLHQTKRRLMCHYCSYEQIPPKTCPSCSQHDQLTERGAGTEKIIDELSELFPEAQLDRLDRDAVNNHQSYTELLDKIRAGKTNILVGTQMIAKGHDLPNVTLVGIADCDVGLHLPDFRASERVFQLLTQAAGRAGRGAKPGKVLLQTKVPLHPVLHFTLTDDFTGFAELELKNRKILSYPPFTKLLRILVQSGNGLLAEKSLTDLTELLKKYIAKHDLKLQVLGPVPAPLEKLKTRWRWHTLIKGKSLVDIHSALYFCQSLKFPSACRISFDIDPQDLL